MIFIIASNSGHSCSKRLIDWEVLLYLGMFGILDLYGGTHVWRGSGKFCILQFHALIQFLQYDFILISLNGLKFHSFSQFSNTSFFKWRFQSYNIISLIVVMSVMSLLCFWPNWSVFHLLFQRPQFFYLVFISHHIFNLITFYIYLFLFFLQWNILFFLIQSQGSLVKVIWFEILYCNPHNLELLHINFI